MNPRQNVGIPWLDFEQEARSPQALRPEYEPVEPEPQPFETVEADPPKTKDRGAKSTTLMYMGLWLFTLLYYLRPNDWLPGTAHFPFEKIAGFITCTGVIIALFRHGIGRFPFDSKLLMLFYIQLCLTVPLASWRGGSFQIVIEEFSKVLLISLAIAICIVSWRRLRQILLLQALLVSALATVSVIVSTSGDRLQGVLHGVFENPNDLAMSICLALPLAYLFFFQSSMAIKKLFWAGLMLVMAYAVVATFSRAGFLSLVTAAGFCVWHFGYRRRSMGLALLMGMAALLIASAVIPNHYASRLGSIFSPEQDTTGSSHQRQLLLERSLEVTMRHPLLGIGPGNFEEVSGNWRVSHNTYTQLSSEAGIPALVLFLWMLVRSWRTLGAVTQQTVPRSELWAAAGALRASLVALCVGAFFASVAYQFFPYFLLTYATATGRIANLNVRKTKLGDATLPNHHSLGANE